MSDTERDLDFQLTDELASFIEALLASEINGEISWFFEMCGAQDRRQVERLSSRGDGVLVARTRGAMAL